MSKNKIFNDPVYGFIAAPKGILFNLVEHPWFQRLRRIKQLSLTHYVYPGALHTRFHHALGAMHLMSKAIEVLRSKDVDISDEEAEAACIAILLHDIGHGPFSHTLEHTLIETAHEALSLLFMQELNKEFDGALDLAIAIFTGQYHKKYLHQLISGQLDMDRMDYLNRDSYFTGVSEGVIGYDRIIAMLAVHNGELVIEEKGSYSIEKFLIARRLMYWQVYLHKTVLSAELMLMKIMTMAKEITLQGHQLPYSGNLQYFLRHEVTLKDFQEQPSHYLNLFAQLDDIDIVAALKAWTKSDHALLAWLSASILDRRLFRLKFSPQPIAQHQIDFITNKLMQSTPFSAQETSTLIWTGQERNTAYTTSKSEIKILFKDGSILPFSQISDFGVQSGVVTKHYLCFPKQF